MTINPFIPVKQSGGNWKLIRKEPTPVERQKFILDAMKEIVEHGEVVFTADPDKIPARVFQHSDMGIFKCNGTWHTWLEIATQRIHIGLRYKDYQIQDRTENQVYMAIRIDVEKIIDIFDNIELKDHK